MNWTTETLPEGRMKFSLILDKKDLSRELNEICEKEQKNIQLKGFRKGHTPLSMIKRIYGPSFQNKLIDHFLQSEFSEEVKKNDLWLINIIDTNHTWDHCEDGVFHNISSTILADSIPKLNIETKGLIFKRKNTTPSSEDIENTKNLLREMKSFLREEENASISKGDFASMDISFELENGESPPSLQIKDQLIEQGRSPLEKIDTELIGMKKGESRIMEDIVLNHPYFKEYEGKKAICRMHVHEIKIKQTPPYDEKLAKQYGYDNMETFEKYISHLTLENKQQEDEILLRREIIETLRKKYPFDIPVSLLESSYPKFKELPETDKEKSTLKKLITDKLSTDVILNQLGQKYGRDFREAYQADSKEYEKKRLEFENSVFEKLYEEIKITDSSSVKDRV